MYCIYIKECVLSGTSVMNLRITLCEAHAFRPKSNWKPPPGHPGLEFFLNQLEKEIFCNLLTDSSPSNSNMSSEEWKALRGLADDRSIVIKKADKGSCVVVWCREDYIKEAERQLEDIKMSIL